MSSLQGDGDHKPHVMNIAGEQCFAPTINHQRRSNMRTRQLQLADNTGTFLAVAARKITCHKDTGNSVLICRSGRETYNAVLSSLRLGYRHVDTARMYGNEADVGKAIRDSGISREEVFVTSKLFDVDWGYDAATDAINGSLESLGMEYLDLMLMHHPGQRQGRKETWQALEAAHKQVQLSLRSSSAESAGYAPTPPP